MIITMILAKKLISFSFKEGPVCWLEGVATFLGHTGDPSLIDKFVSQDFTSAQHTITGKVSKSKNVCTYGRGFGRCEVPLFLVSTFDYFATDATGEGSPLSWSAPCMNESEYNRKRKEQLPYLVPHNKAKASTTCGRVLNQKADEYILLRFSHMDIDRPTEDLSLHNPRYQAEEEWGLNVLSGHCKYQPEIPSSRWLWCPTCCHYPCFQVTFQKSFQCSLGK